MSSHATRAARFLEDEGRARRHDAGLWHVRAARDRAAASVPEWEALREHAAAVRAHAATDLAPLLEELEQRVTAHGAVVHWAADAAEHNRIVLELLRARGVRRVVKSKSMLTEECGLNPFLEASGIEVTDTDLGEWIVQLRDEPPSHIVMPAIHLSRQEVGATFHEHLGTPAAEDDPTRLTRHARGRLRERFLAAEAGITGVNMAVAETGDLLVCTNEGNADLGMALPPLHIACMGLEKVVPRLSDAAVLLRLLARSATGQASTAFTSRIRGPRPGGELHLVIVDNGRSRLAADPEQHAALACIRCGACLNTCPVYRRSGGHSYAATIPGPIGSVLGPARDPRAHGSLADACTLCGSCDAVCPVRIPLHRQLLAWRARLRAGGPGGAGGPGLRIAAAVLARPRLAGSLGRLGRLLLRLAPASLAAGLAGPWARGRSLPAAPARSLREELARRTRR